MTQQHLFATTRSPQPAQSYIASQTPSRIGFSVTPPQAGQVNFACSSIEPPSRRFGRDSDSRLERLVGALFFYDYYYYTTMVRSYSNKLDPNTIGL